MKTILSLIACLVCLSGFSAGSPYSTIYSRNLNQKFPSPATIATNTTMLYQLVTNALSGTTVYLNSGSFTLNTPLVMPAGVTLSGQGSNATIIINNVRGDGAIAGRGCGIVPGNFCTIQYLQITNALAQTNYQGCIGAVTPQPIFTGLTTRGLLCCGSSDVYQINQDSAFVCVWNDFNCVVTSKWDTAVFICNDFNNPATMFFHSQGSTFSSVGPSAIGGQTSHGIYAQVDFLDLVLDGVTLSATGNSINRAWQIDSGLEEGDTTGTFQIKNSTMAGLTVNNASIVPATNTFLISTNSSNRDGSYLTNLTGANVVGNIPGNAATATSVAASGLPYRSGTTNIGNLATSILVTFTSALANTNYAVAIGLDSTLGAAVTPAATLKTVNGFTLTLSAGIAGGATLDYMAWPYR